MYFESQTMNDQSHEEKLNITTKGKRTPSPHQKYISLNIYAKKDRIVEDLCRTTQFLEGQVLAWD
jgi:acetylglutamate synthase